MISGLSTSVVSDRTAEDRPPAQPLSLFTVLQQEFEELHGAGGTPGAPARATRGQRWLARLAFAAAFAAVVVLLLSGALRSAIALLLGSAGVWAVGADPPAEDDLHLRVILVEK